jgi:hypothetical protein
MFREARMIIQTNAEMFYRNRPVHTVTNIDRSKGAVTLSGSDGSSLDVRLDSWGHLEVTQPVIGSKVQLLDDNDKPGV